MGDSPAKKKKKIPHFPSGRQMIYQIQFKILHFSGSKRTVCGGKKVVVVSAR